jgi:hypothetical protein
VIRGPRGTPLDCRPHPLAADAAALLHSISSISFSDLLSDPWRRPPVHPSREALASAAVAAAACLDLPSVFDPEWIAASYGHA